MFHYKLGVYIRKRGLELSLQKWPSAAELHMKLEFDHEVAVEHAPCG